MKITVIFDIDAVDFKNKLEFAAESLYKKGIETELFDLNVLDIHHCIGCFGCWVKNPGQCVFDDAMTSILKTQMKSDWVIYFSKMAAGTLGYKTKNVIDRTIPIVLPHIGVFGGEFHHKKRYSQYPNRAFMILDDKNATEQSMKILKEIAAKNALNMHCDKYVAKVFGMQSIEEDIYEIIST